MKPTVLFVAALLLLAGCGGNMSESRKFVIAADSINVSMKTINNLYDENLIAKQDYKAAAEVFFHAVNYITQWDESIKSGTPRPELRFKVIELARQLAIIALIDEESDNE